MQDRAPILILPGSFSSALIAGCQRRTAQPLPSSPAQRLPGVSGSGLAPGKSAPISAAGGEVLVSGKKNNPKEKVSKCQSVNLRASAGMTPCLTARKHHPESPSSSSSGQRRATIARTVRGQACGFGNSGATSVPACVPLPALSHSISVAGPGAAAAGTTPRSLAGDWQRLTPAISLWFCGLIAGLYLFLKC